MSGEFSFIARHFRPLAGEGSFSLRNDGAVLSLAEGEQLVVSSDTMVENVHFLPDDPAKTIGRKLLRCNLSDLAAMGASPYAYTLNVSVPKNGRYDDSWFAEFSSGLAADQAAYGLSLLGGDTTGISGPLVLSLTIFGRVKQGQALTRSGSQCGDGVWVTGTIGDAVLGLYARWGKLEDPTGRLTQAYRIPEPPMGLRLHGIASAAMDISDGLVQDCGHLARESGTSFHIQAALVPASPEARQCGPQWLKTRLTGGDNYQLVLTCPPEREDALHATCRDAGIRITRIGEVCAGEGVHLTGEDGQALSFEEGGWQHF